VSALESHRRPCSIAIVTFADDLHALVIQDRLRSMPETRCAIIERKLGDVLGRLGLRMGVADLKITPAGDPVWLELNPQGQFLFLEGLTGLDLTGAFADFLRDEARRAGSAR
jgi:hypothetical protein